MNNKNYIQTTIIKRFFKIKFKIYKMKLFNGNKKLKKVLIQIGNPQKILIDLVKKDIKTK